MMLLYVPVHHATTTVSIDSLIRRWVDQSEDVHCLCVTGWDEVSVVRAERQAVDVDEPSDKTYMYMYTVNTVNDYFLDN